MDPNDLIKAVPEIGKIAAELGFTDAVRRMLGPAIDEVGEVLRDRVKLYRYERQARLLDKFDQITKEAGFIPQAVPPKILFPLLEGTSFEDDENLHDMWAALLANAASPDNAGKVRPGFIAILREMAPDEAAPFKTIAGTTDEYFRTFQEPTKAAVTQHSLLLDHLLESFVRSDGENESAVEERFLTCLQVLDNAGLVEMGGGTVMLGRFGGAFLEACQPPSPKS